MPRDGMSERAALVAGIQARDAAAIRQIVERYADHVFPAARGSGLSRQEAEDVCQATFMTFVETAPRFEGRSRVRTWLFGILYRKLAKMRRNQEKERRTDDIDQIFEQRFQASGRWSAPPAEADRAVFAEELRNEISTCLDRTPLKQRMAFLLREVEGLSSEEIRAILGVSVNNLGVLLFRVRNRLRECLEARGLAP